MFNIRWHNEGPIRTIIVDGDLDLASGEEFLSIRGLNRFFDGSE